MSDDSVKVCREIFALREIQESVNAGRLGGVLYQVVGCLLSDTGQFDTPEGQQVLDWLAWLKGSRERPVGDPLDLLPWHSVEQPSVDDDPIFGVSRIDLGKRRSGGIGEG